MSLALAIGAFTHEMFALYCKQYINLFAIGRSNFKTYMFLFYLAAVFFTLARRSRTPPGRPLLLTGILLPLTLYGVGAAEHAWLANRYGLGFFEQMDVYTNGELCSTSGYHIHTGKLALAALAPWFTKATLFHFDPGVALLPYFPSWLPLAQALGVLVTAWVMTRVVLSAYFDPRLSGSWWTVLLIAAFSVFKNILDGGICSPESLISLPFYLAVMLHLLKPGQRTPLVTALALGLAGSVAYALGVNPNIPFRGTEVLKFAVPLTVLYATILGAAALWRRRQKELAAVLVVFVNVVHVNCDTLIGLHTFATGIIRYANWGMNPEEIYVAVAGSREAVSDELVEIISTQPVADRQIVHFRILKHCRLKDLENPQLTLNYHQVVRLPADGIRLRTRRIPMRLHVPEDQVIPDGSTALPGVASYRFLPVRPGVVDFVIEIEPGIALPKTIIGLAFEELGVSRILMREPRKHLYYN